MKRKIMSILLCWMLVFSMTTPALANTVSSTDEITANIISDSTKVYSGADVYMKGETTANNVTMSDAAILLDESSIELKMVINDSSTMFVGKVYSIDGNGFYDNRMVVGDFMPSNGYNIVSFKVFNEINELQSFPGVAILIEEITTGTLIEVKFSIAASDFARLINLAKSTTSLEKQICAEAGMDIKEVDEKILQLLVNSKQFVAENNVPTNTSAVSSEFRSTATYSSQNMSYDTLIYFMNRLDTVGSMTLSTSLSNYVKQTGFKYNYGTTTNSEGTVDCFHILHGVVNSSEERLVTFSTGLVGDTTESGAILSGGIRIVDSCTISYNTVTNTATLLYSNWGPAMKNVTVAIELVGGETYFKSATKTGSFTNDRTFNVLSAIANDLGVSSAIWEALGNSVTNMQTVSYYDREYQVGAYHGVIRAVAHELGRSYYLQDNSQEVGIRGTYSTDAGDTYNSYRVSYKFKLTSDL